MKKEDIEKAAQECAERIASIAYSGGGHIGQDDLETAFEVGSEWRINSVWHDNNEYPDENLFCLYILKDGSYGCGYYHKRDNTIWYESFEEVKMWAYIKDLIPNTED